MEAEGAAREGRVSREEGDKEGRSRKFHYKVLYVKLYQAIRRLTAR